MTLLGFIDWHSFFFAFFGLIACVFALGVLFSSNIVRMAFYLIISLGATSGLFFLAGAEFVGAMQLMIYVGGTLVLLVFGVMLTAQKSFISMKTRGGEWVLAAAVGGSLLVTLLYTAFQVRDWLPPEGWTKKRSEVSKAQSEDTTRIGAALIGQRTDKLNVPTADDATDVSAAQRRRLGGMSGYLLPFEIVSVHLLVVLIGAGYLARTKRRSAARRVTVPARELRAPRPLGLPLVIGVASGMVVNAALAVLCFVFQSQILAWLAGQLIHPAAWVVPGVGVLFAANVLLLAVVLGRQRWAVFGLVLAPLTQAGIIIVGGAGPVLAGLFLVVFLVPPAAMIFLLCSGGSNSIWAEME